MKRGLIECFFISIILSACINKNIETDKSYNKYKQDFEKNFLKIIDKCLYENKTFKLYLKQKVIFENNIVDKIELSVNKEFKIIDNHSTQTYTFKNNSNNNINLNYSYIFDHRSFGKNKISNDSGLLEIPCIK